MTQDTRAIEAFMSALVHPCKTEIEALRKLMLGVDASIAEGVKWNVPSFRTTEWFATTHLRAKSGFGVVFHFGAKARALPKGGLAIEDPDKLLEWLGKDRAIVAFADAKDFAKKKAAFKAIVRQWIRFV